MARLNFLPKEFPEGLEALPELALDLRWTWTHEWDALWREVDDRAWEKTRNPWAILQDIPEKRLKQLAGSPRFRKELERLTEARRAYLADPGWYGGAHGKKELKGIAYLSMEFGLSEALPLYAGGLGVLAGDYLKAASDLGLPVVGVGLLYQEGYFRQVLDAGGRQQEVYPYNDAIGLPLQPVLSPSGGWLRVILELPGRALHIRIWKASVGRVALYLLDTNDPLNSPVDRGIASKLYGGGIELRFLQEIVLGFGGFRLLSVLGLEADVLHLNEGHAAFAVIERARSFMKASGLSFGEALWATRAGNVFTTHTSVGAGFDAFPPLLVEKYFPPFCECLMQLGISVKELLGLGRKDPDDPDEPFKMAHLALRGSTAVNGVSRLHGRTSRRIFGPLFPRWPEREIPVTHITNGVHVPSWDSPWADDAWTRACGKGRWRGMGLEELCDSVRRLSDEELWDLRTKEREDLVRFARKRLALHLGQMGMDPETAARAHLVLDPRALTLGFARRFSEYKRPALLLKHPERLIALLTSKERPVQLIIAGKAHPQDDDGKRLVMTWANFAADLRVRERAVFLADYDITLAQELVQGVDVWINTPRRPWEASGTSGMKVLANGGLNLSVLDGWWEEAYSPEAGWAIGDGREDPDPERDDAEAAQLYDILEGRVIPEFYARDAQGIPRAWVARMRASMAGLTPRFSSNRMVREYVEKLYLPAAGAWRRRTARNAALAVSLSAWSRTLAEKWPDLRFGEVDVKRGDGVWEFRARVDLGRLDPSFVAVEIYAEPSGEAPPLRVAMEPSGPQPGPGGGERLYVGEVSGDLPSDHYTLRVVPSHPEVRVPLEESHILWQR